MPWSGPRVLPAARSSSRNEAISRASGFVSITELTFGPFLSNAEILSKYISAILRADHSPEVIFSCNSDIVHSSMKSSNKKDTVFRRAFPIPFDYRPPPVM